MPPIATTAATTAAFPDNIEIFRAGSRMDDAGRVHVISNDDVTRCAAAYDTRVHEAPLVLGHPKDNAPAYGWVSALRVPEPGVLTSDHSQVDASFAEYAAAGRVKKRSASFYHPADPSNPKPGIWYLRHVGYLGAQPPAVKGLKDPSFADSGDSCISFSETVIPTTVITDTQEHIDMSKELQDKLDAATTLAATEKAAREKAEGLATAAQAQLTQFAEAARTTRHAGYVSFAEAQVKAGTLLPKDTAMAAATLNALADAAPVEFAEGDTKRTVSPAQWLQDLIAGAKPVVSFGEFAPGRIEQAGAGSAKGKTDAEIDTAAKAYAHTHKVSYAEAASAVVGFTA